MKQLVATAGFVLSTALSVYSQTPAPQTSLHPCTLTLAQAPSVRGVRLGMTVDEFLALFPGSNDDGQVKRALSQADGYPQFGKAFFGVTPANYATKDLFGGISFYTVQSFDRRIVQLNVIYEGFPNGPKWKNVDDLIQKFAESFHLPGAKDWLLEPSTSDRKGLACNGFQVWASTANDRSNLTFFHNDWIPTQKERLARYEEQKRSEFKP